MKSVQALIIDEEGKVPKATERSNLALRYELQFLSNDGSQAVRKVKVRSIDFYDVIRHLREGDSVLITPKLQENSAQRQRHNCTSWYFTHM